MIKNVSNDLIDLRDVKEFKYDSSDFFTFLELFRIEKNQNNEFRINKGAKYNLIFQEEISNAKNSEEFLNHPFFNKYYIIDEVIKRVKKLDNRKFQEDIDRVEKYKRFNLNMRGNELTRDFKKEVSEIFNNILEEAKIFIPRIKFELVEELENVGYIMEVTYISNGEENSFTKLFK